MTPSRMRGRKAALSALGLENNTPDNPILTKFVEGLPEHTPRKPGRSGENTQLRRQGWGKKFEFSTSDQDASGGGARR